MHVIYICSMCDRRMCNRRMCHYCRGSVHTGSDEEETNANEFLVRFTLIRVGKLLVTVKYDSEQLNAQTRILQYILILNGIGSTSVNKISLLTCHKTEVTTKQATGQVARAGKCNYPR